MAVDDSEAELIERKREWSGRDGVVIGKGPTEEGSSVVHCDDLVLVIRESSTTACDNTTAVGCDRLTVQSRQNRAVSCWCCCGAKTEKTETEKTAMEAVGERREKSFRENSSALHLTVPFRTREEKDRGGRSLNSVAPRHWTNHPTPIHQHLPSSTPLRLSPFTLCLCLCRLCRSSSPPPNRFAFHFESCRAALSAFPVIGVDDLRSGAFPSVDLPTLRIASSLRVCGLS